MKTIKNVLLFALFFTGTMVFAQQNYRPRQDGSDMSFQRPEKFILEQLNLSVDQKAKLDEIQKSYKQKDSLVFVELQNKKEQERVERMKDFKSILNNEQQAQFEKMLLERADREIFNEERNPERTGRPAMRPQGGKEPGMQGCPFQGQDKVQGIGQEPGAPCCSQKGEGPREGQKMQAQDGFVGKEKSEGFGKLAPDSRNHRFEKDKQSVLSPEQRAQKQTQHLTKELQLNKKQAAKIQDIILKYAKKDTLCTDSEKSAKNKEIKSVLNNQQIKKFEDLQKHIK